MLHSLDEMSLVCARIEMEARKTSAGTCAQKLKKWGGFDGKRRRGFPKGHPRKRYWNLQKRGVMKKEAGRTGRNRKQRHSWKGGSQGNQQSIEVEGVELGVVVGVKLGTEAGV